MPATPLLVGEYLADLGEGYAKATLRRKVAAIGRACRLAGSMRPDTGSVRAGPGRATAARTKVPRPTSPAVSPRRASSA